MKQRLGRYTDGKTSATRPVYIRIFKQGIALFEDADLTKLIERWSYQDMQVNHDWTDGIGASFEHKEKYGATLSVEHQPLFQTIKKNLHKHDQATYLISTRATTLMALTVVAIAVVIYGFPLLSKSIEQLAYIVPESVQKEIGDIAVESMDDEFIACNDKVAQQYLDTITTRLLASYKDKSVKPKIHIYKTPMINAFALPDSHMAVLTGFLKNAQSEEEIAGVLAHEIGHIANKDPLKFVMQAQGLNAVSTLIGSSGSYGSVGQMAATLSELNYSREKEAAADRFAYGLLQKAGYSTNGLISFLEMADTKSPKYLQSFQENLSFLSTHPKTEERLKKLRMPDGTVINYKPSLSEEQMNRLRKACAYRSPKKQIKTRQD